MRLPVFLSALMACALPPITSAADAPRLSCDVTYAGATQRVEARPVTEPYAVPSVDIGERFLFKAVMVEAGPALSPRIGLYVYRDASPQPVLIQHARYVPPYPLRRDGGPVDLTGEQHLYAGPLERELIYRCWLSGGRP